MQIAAVGRPGLKYLNCLHELCVTAAAAAPTADRVDKWATSTG